MLPQQIVDPGFFLSSAARAGHYATVALLFGTFLFALVVVRPTVGRVPNMADERRHLGRFLLWLSLGSLVAALLTGAILFWITAAGISGRPLSNALTLQALGGVLARTNFGRVWQIRLVVAVLLAVMLVFLLCRSAAKDSRFGELLAGSLAGVLLASLALVGHSNDRTGLGGTFRLGADMLHLLAAGAWLGSLPGLAYVLTRAGDLTSPTSLRIGREAARRFSALGIVSVAVLVLSGFVNSWFLVGTLPGLVGTSYGHILLLKLALFIIMVILAAINREWLTPQLALSAAPGPSGQEIVRKLRRNTIAEIAVGLAILGVAGVLVAAAPAIGEQPVWPFPYQLDTTHLSITNLSMTRGLGPIFIKAGILGLVGVLAIIWSLRRRAWWGLLIGVVAIGAALKLPAPYVLIDAYPTSFYRSPIPYDSASIARGRLFYMENCAICHGSHGYGDGPAAASLPVWPADLTHGHSIHHGEGELFWLISHGVKNTPMPAFADRLDENARWDLVNFLDAQADVERANVMTFLTQPFQPIVAPDIVFQVYGHEQETLVGQRGKANVLLIFYSLPGSLPRIEALDAARSSLEATGLRIIAIPVNNDTESLLTEDLMAHATFLTVSDPDAVATYTSFRRVPIGGGALPPPQHIEFLVDRAGYLRARWIPAERKGWSDLAVLQSEIDRLNREPPRPAAPEGHVH